MPPVQAPSVESNATLSVPAALVLLEVPLMKAAAGVVALGRTAADFAAIPDAHLRAAQGTVMLLQRELDQVKASLAGTIAYRSRRELGNSGLAQREGFRSPEQFIESVSGVTRAESTKFVAVGKMMNETAELEELQKVDPVAATVVGVVPATGFATDASWQGPLAHAVTAGTLGMDAADAIRRGLGSADAAVTGGILRDAVTALIADAEHSTPDAVGRLARQVRESLDVEAVVRREKTQQDLEFLRVRKCKDGMVRGEFALTPENGELLMQVLDTGTSPRRGGPRFVDEGDTVRAERIIDDPRSNEQLNAATLIAAVQLATQADPTRMLGSRLPAVRMIVAQKTVTTGIGFGRLQESGDAVSLTVIERAICNTGIVKITIDDTGQPIDVSREQRLFTGRQRIGFAVHNGGCMDPDCTRPPAWTEIHHIRFWDRDNGPTNMANGISLCKADHLRYHNNGWEIELIDGLHWLIPPADLHPAQTPRPMWSKNPEIRTTQARTPEKLAADREQAHHLAITHTAQRQATAAAKAATEK